MLEQFVNAEAHKNHILHKILLNVKANCKVITMAESYMVSPWKSHNKFSRVLYQPKNQKRISKTLKRMGSWKYQMATTSKIKTKPIKTLYEPKIANLDKENKSK